MKKNTPSPKKDPCCRHLHSKLFPPFPASPKLRVLRTSPSFAKGVDQAINVLATDEALARQIEQAIENLQSIEGADAIRSKLLEARRTIGKITVSL